MMPKPKPPSFLLLLLLISLVLVVFPITSRSASSDTFIYGGCSQQQYLPTSSYQANLDSLLASLANSAFSALYAKFTIGKPGDPNTVTGLLQCRGDLPARDCSRCAQDAIGQLHLLCQDACGAALQLDSCFVKYDNATFMGVLDTTLIYKKCSPSSSAAYDSDFLGRKDDTLRQLSSSDAGGYFRTASSGGFVLGVAQCVADLSPGDCSQCVSEAVGKLREVCGSAISGDVYLGKCYARYYAAGLYSRTTHDSSNRGDEAGKTLAIIIGLFAGVALIIVFLSFLRKVCSGKGKACSREGSAHPVEIPNERHHECVPCCEVNELASERGY